MLLVLACAQPATDTEPDFVEGAPTHWWTWSYECATEQGEAVMVPALPTTDPLVMSFVTLAQDTTGAAILGEGSGQLDPDGGSKDLCGDGDISGRLTLAW